MKLTEFSFQRAMSLIGMILWSMKIPFSPLKTVPKLAKTLEDNDSPHSHTCHDDRKLKTVVFLRNSQLILVC